MVTRGRIDNGLDDVRMACSVRGVGMPFMLVGKSLITCARLYGAIAQWQVSFCPGSTDESFHQLLVLRLKGLVPLHSS